MGTEQVLYRAKRKEDQAWVEGYYAKGKHWFSGEEIHMILPTDLEIYPRGEFSSYEEILPETLGRLLDPPCYDAFYENEKIYQGDIIAVWRSRSVDISKEDPYVIALVLDEHSIQVNGLGRLFPQDTTRIRVIGNIYDNPDLLRKEK